MKDCLFFFDLDATITKVEILPEIAKDINKAEEMIELTKKTMTGEIPFYHSFIERINILKTVPVSEVQEIIKNVPLNEKIVEFLRENKERCYVVTSNLDVWVMELMKDLGLWDRCFCSKATVKDDYILGVDHIIDKSKVVKQFEDRTIVAVGDGNNDAEMFMASDISIGFGGVHHVASTVLKCATHVVYSEDRLCQFLRQLL